MDPAEKQKIITRLEELGPTQVRLMLSRDGLPPAWNLTTIEWLGQKTLAEKAGDDAWRAEQRKTANSTKLAAWIAAIAAIAAIFVPIFIWVFSR